MGERGLGGRLDTVARGEVVQRESLVRPRPERERALTSVQEIGRERPHVGAGQKTSRYGSSARLYAASSAARSPVAKRRRALAPAYGKWQAANFHVIARARRATSRTSTSGSIRVGAPVVTDGRFAEFKELLAATGWAPWVGGAMPSRSLRETSAAPGPGAKPLGKEIQVRPGMDGPARDERRGLAARSGAAARAAVRQLDAGDAAVAGRAGSGSARGRRGPPQLPQSSRWVRSPYRPRRETYKTSVRTSLRTPWGVFSSRVSRWRVRS
jgi:hypothetical protein